MQNAYLEHDFVTYDSPYYYWDFCNRFAKRNQLKILGNGYFSMVYANQKNPYAYKIGRVDSTVENDAYLNFVKTAMQENNPYLPQFRTVTVFKHSQGDFYVVEMEKLNPCRYYDIHKEDQKVRDDILDLFNDRKCEKISYKWQETITRHVAHASKLFHTLFDLLQKFDNDMHEANMMMRSCGQLVITDPLCPKGMVTPEF